MSTVAYAQLTNMRDLATALVNARMRVALSVTDEGLPFVLGDVVDDDRAGQVPPSCRVTCSVLAICKKLERMLLKKKPSARSGSQRRPYGIGLDYLVGLLVCGVFSSLIDSMGLIGAGLHLCD